MNPENDSTNIDNLRLEIRKELEEEIRKEIEAEEKEEKKQKKKEFKLFKNISMKIKFIILIVILIAIVIIGVLIPTKLNSKEVLINFGFKDVGVLVTQEWYGRIIEVSTKDRKIFDGISIPFTESKRIFSIDVEVIAAIDFEKIEYDIKEEQKKIKIKLPHSFIYKKYPVENSFESYLDSESWFSNINATEQQTLIDRITEKGENDAIESGILDKADKNAEDIIRNMIKSNKSTKDFEIEFEYK